MLFSELYLYIIIIIISLWDPFLVTSPNRSFIDYSTIAFRMRSIKIGVTIIISASPSSLGHYQYRQLHQQPTNAHYPAQRNKSSPQQQAQAPPHHLPPASPHPPLPAAAEDDELFFVVSGSEEEEEEGREEVSQADPGDHLWGVGSDNRRGASTGDVTLTTSDEGGDGLDMLPQDPALILPDQVDFYAQIKVGDMLVHATPYTYPRCY